MSMPRPAHPFSMALWVLWNLGAMILLISTAFTCFPGLHHDSALYATPIVNAAARGVWEIESFVPSLISESGTLFTRHGQLYQAVFGRVLRCASYTQLLAWASVLNTATFLAALLISQRLLRDQHPRLAPVLSSGIAAMTALFTLWVQGRPEQIIPALMLLPWAAHLWQRTARYARYAGYSVLGLVVVTSPLPGLLCCLGVVAWIGLRHRQSFFSETAICATISLFTAVLTLLIICPVNPWQWVHNTTQASVGTPSNLGAFFTHLTDDIPLWNLVILGSMALLFAALVRHRLALLAVLLAAVFISLLWKLQVYVLAAFVPIIMLVLASQHGTEALRLPRLLNPLPLLLVLLVSLTSLYTLGRTGLLALSFSRQGTSFAATATVVRELQTSLPKNERVGFFWIARPSFVAFGEPGKGLLTLEPEVLRNRPDPALQTYEQTHGCRVRYALLPQHSYLIPPGSSPPSVMGGGAFALVRNGWTSDPAKVWGLTLAQAIPGYQFALYRRVD